VTADNTAESARNPQRRDRLSATALTAWDLERTRGRGAHDERSRLMILKTQERLRALAEAELGVPKHQRSFLKQGKPGKPGVLMIHEAGQTPAEFVPLARHLNAAGLTVHAMLLAGYGHGVTDRPEARWRASLQQVRLGHRLLAETSGAVHAVGMGFGAALALHLAEREPVASLVLLAPALVPRVGPRIRFLRALGLLHFPPVRRRLGLVVDALDGMQQAQDLAGRVDVPVFGVQCDDDEQVSPQSLRLLQRRARHAGSRFRVYPTGGHDPLAAHGSAGLDDEILAFIEGGR
jgi:pimeloyl-ACP methyl ester carboxylesterase